MLPFVARQLASLRLREIEQALVVGGFGGAGMLFQMDGMTYTSASTAAFLTQGSCVFIPIWVAIFDRSWPPLKVCLSVVMVLAGVGVLAGIQWSTFKLGRGEIEILLSALMFTGQILSLERPRYAGNHPICMTFVLFLVMAAVALPIALNTSPGADAWWRAYGSPASAGMLAILVVFCTMIAFCLMNFWQRHVRATEAGLIYCAEPVFTSIAVLFLPALLSQWAEIDYPNESITARLLAGGGLITVVNVLLLSRWLEPKSEVPSKA